MSELPKPLVLSRTTRKRPPIQGEQRPDALASLACLMDRRLVVELPIRGFTNRGVDLLERDSPKRLRDRLAGCKSLRHYRRIPASPTCAGMRFGGTTTAHPTRLRPARPHWKSFRSRSRWSTGAYRLSIDPTHGRLLVGGMPILLKVAGRVEAKQDGSLHHRPFLSPAARLRCARAAVLQRRPGEPTLGPSAGGGCPRPSPTRPGHARSRSSV